MSKEEVDRLLELRRRKRAQEQAEDSQQAGTFEPPTAKIDEILETAREMSRRYGILLPPPFSPFESLPKLPEKSRSNPLEDMPRLPELPKKEEPKSEPTIVCSRCGTPNNESALYCSRCGGFLQARWEPDRGYTMRK
jgi:ribosomal protein L37E